MRSSSLGRLTGICLHFLSLFFSSKFLFQRLYTLFVNFVITSDDKRDRFIILHSGFLYKINSFACFTTSARSNAFLAAISLANLILSASSTFFRDRSSSFRRFCIFCNFFFHEKKYLTKIAKQRGS